MASYKVTTPAPGYTGAVGSVTFVDGAAVVDSDTHAAELAYFRAQGYDVADTDPHTDDDVDALRAEAAALGLKVHHKAKAETIRKQIDEAHAATDDTNDDTPDEEQGTDQENDQP